MTRSAAICQALLNAERDPGVLSRAFQLRLNTDFEENDVEIKYTRDKRLDKTVEELSRMTRLPGQQVIRLCMEAYIHKL